MRRRVEDEVASPPITEGGERKPKFSLCITLAMVMVMVMVMVKRNLSEEFFTASERPKPRDWPQPARVGDVSTLEVKCESANV